MFISPGCEMLVRLTNITSIAASTNGFNGRFNGFSSFSYSVADLFMGYHEKDWIEKAQVAKPTFYKR